MNRSFAQMLIGRKILDHKLLSPKTDSQSPDVIHVEHHLGEYRFGNVFQARFCNNSKAAPFILKIPCEPLGETYRYIQNEVNKLERLATPENHQIPFIQKSFFEVDDKQLPVYLTSFCVPSDIHFSELSQRQPIPHYRVLRMFYLLAKTLEYLEENQIVHGDIHPQAIHFYQEMPIIVHWVAAKYFSEIPVLGSDKVLAATYTDISWLPPEVLDVEMSTKGNPEIHLYLEEINCKTDVWGLGLLLMYYLTGIMIFDEAVPSRNADEVLECLLQTPHRQILNQYRRHSQKILKERYLQSNNTPSSEFFTFLRDLHGPPPISSIDVDLRLRFNLDDIMATRSKLLLGDRNEYFIKHFYLQILMVLFEMCTTSAKLRVTATQLIRVMEVLLPGLPGKAMSIVARPYVPFFQQQKLSGVREPAFYFKKTSPIQKTERIRFISRRRGSDD